MRAPWLALALVVALVACGGPRSRPPLSQATDEHIDTAPPACTRWDPGADPTRAPTDVAAPPEHAQRSLSGLRWCVLRPGTGNQHPDLHDRVTVHYSGWTTDGQMFDSSHTRGEPATFPVDALIAGWTEGLQLMTVGEVRRFWIPASLAYGHSHSGPQGMLVFDVELIAILGL